MVAANGAANFSTTHTLPCLSRQKWSSSPRSAVRSNAYSADRICCSSLINRPSSRHCLLVPAYRLSYALKYILLHLIVWLNGSHGMLLYSVQVQRYLVQTGNCWKLNGLLVRCPLNARLLTSPMTMRVGSCPENSHVQVILRNCKRLAHHASNRIFCSSTFQCLGMGQKHGRHQFHFSHK